MSTCLLAVDTATEIGGVALLIDGQVKSELILSQGVTHSRSIMAAIDAVLDINHMDIDGIDVYAVTRGPGSFTGLRIGIGTVKGLAMAAAKPLVGISSLAVLAHQAPAISDMVCPIMDARRNEVYWTLYQRDGKGSLNPVMDEQVGPVSTVAESIEWPCCFIGNGVSPYREELAQLLGEPMQWGDDTSNGIRPSVLAKLAWQRIVNGDNDDIRAFSPEYLRKSDAEMSRNSKGASFS
jgi:tRNA threonylcarbamoyladenosine biosynthesis protein TsaB